MTFTVTLPVSNIALSLELNRKDLFGEIRKGRFIIHKLPEHVVQLYQAFGCGRQRLLQMHRLGVTECVIFFHPNKDTVECYKTTVQNWLKGLPWKNKLAEDKVEEQCLLLIDDCERL